MGFWESFYSTFGPTPEVNAISQRIAILTAVLIVLLIILFVPTWIALASTKEIAKKDNMGNDISGTNGNGGLYTGAGTGFNSGRDDRFAPTPYPYAASCGYVEDEVTYALNVAKENEPDLTSSPLYPQWKVLLTQFLAAKKASLANPSDSSLADAMKNTRAALDAYEMVNNFRPWIPDELRNQYSSFKASPSFRLGFKDAPVFRPGFVPGRDNRAASGYSFL